MPLYELDGKLRDPQKTESCDYIKALKRVYKSTPQTIEKIIRTVDEAIDYATEHKANVVWIKARNGF